MYLKGLSLSDLTMYNPTNTQCLQWHNSYTTHIAEVNLLHILYCLVFLSLSCM